MIAPRAGVEIGGNSENDRQNDCPTHRSQSGFHNFHNKGKIASVNAMTPSNVQSNSDRKVTPNGDLHSGFRAASVESIPNSLGQRPFLSRAWGKATTGSAAPGFHRVRPR